MISKWKEPINTQLVNEPITEKPASEIKQSAMSRWIGSISSEQIKRTNNLSKASEFNQSAASKQKGPISSQQNEMDQSAIIKWSSAMTVIKNIMKECCNDQWMLKWLNR